MEFIIVLIFGAVLATGVVSPKPNQNEQSEEAQVTQTIQKTKPEPV